MQNTFEAFGLGAEILEAISLMGFVTPTEIQEQAIPKIINSNRDLIALAQTGTGKTGAFGLPCLQKIDPEELTPQVLVLSPTRELALQIAKEFKKFAKKMNHIKTVALYGGADIRSQSRALAKGCHIVVGTPGRTLDFIRQGRLDLSMVSMVVLDEADEMLKMGFQEDLESILSETPEEKQTLLFSATMPKPIEKMAKKYMKEPDRVSVGARNAANDDVTHSYVLSHRNDRYQALTRIVDALPEIYGIIFCRTRNETVEIAAQLQKDGYPVDILNGDLSQDQRDRVMRRFRHGDVKILVATDVAARGLDVNELTHIINFNLPDDLEVYVHRSGRTGRAGNQGEAITLVTHGDRHRLNPLERMMKAKFEQRMIPTGEEIAEAQLKYALGQMDSIEIPAELKEKFAPIIAQKMTDYSMDELQDKILALLCGAILQNYTNAADLNTNVDKGRKRKKDRKRNQTDRKKNREKGGRERKERKRRDSDANFSRCQINVGRKNGMSPHRLMGLINENYKGPKPDFGRIDIGSKETVFDIDQSAVSHVLGFSGIEWEGKKIQITKA